MNIVLYKCFQNLNSSFYVNEGANEHIPLKETMMGSIIYLQFKYAQITLYTVITL